MNIEVRASASDTLEKTLSDLCGVERALEGVRSKEPDG
jgi:hypothetical protein